MASIQKADPDRVASQRRAASRRALAQQAEYDIAFAAIRKQEAERAAAEAKEREEKAAALPTPEQQLRAKSASAGASVIVHASQTPTDAARQQALKTRASQQLAATMSGENKIKATAAVSKSRAVSSAFSTRIPTLAQMPALIASRTYEARLEAHNAKAAMYAEKTVALAEEKARAAAIVAMEEERAVIAKAEEEKLLALRAIRTSAPLKRPVAVVEAAAAAATEQPTRMEETEEMVQ